MALTSTPAQPAEVQTPSSTDTNAFDVTEPPSLFARLIPRNAQALRSFSSVVDAIINNPGRVEHQRKFVQYSNSRVSLRSLLRNSSSPSESATDIATDTEPDPEPDIPPSNENDSLWDGCYLLSLEIPPALPAVGWRAGAGRWTGTDQSGSVEFLLSHSMPHPGVRGSHISFRFNQESGILMLHAWHKQGAKLNSRSVERHNSPKALNKSSSVIQIADFEYEFRYTMEPGTALEQVFQSRKKDFFRSYLQAPAPFEATSATPSANDMSVGNWTLHGGVGIGSFGLVSAASNRNGEVVAFKQLTRHDRATAANITFEVNSAQGIKSAANTHAYKEYLIQLKEVIYQRTLAEFAGGLPEQVYILYTPLARGTFDSDILANKTDPPSLQVRISLFTQVLKGLQCLHSIGWAHRDLKPTNLGIVSLEPPRAVILDVGQACQLPANGSSGIPPTPGGIGTVWYLAPEMETQPYTAAVDIWAAGVVAHELFLDFHPWKMSVNPWRPDRNSKMKETIAAYDSRMKELRTKPKEHIQNLILSMLRWDHEKRCSAEEGLEHPSLQTQLEDPATVIQPGNKRPRE